MTQSKTKGHCQACLRQQVVNDKTGRMSLHGYQVAGFGYFAGTCKGSKERPLEKDTAILDIEVINLRKEALSLVNATPEMVEQVPVIVGRKTVLMSRASYAEHHEERNLYGEPDEAYDWLAQKTLSAMKAEGEYMLKFADTLVRNRDLFHGQDLLEIEVELKPVYETKTKRFIYETDADTTRAQMDDPERKRAYSAAKDFIRALYDDPSIKTKGVRRDTGHLQVKGPMRMKPYGQDDWDGKSYTYKVTYERRTS